jgi:hypothetical protein
MLIRGAAAPVGDSRFALPVLHQFTPGRVRQVPGQNGHRNLDALVNMATAAGLRIEMHVLEAA